MFAYAKMLKFVHYPISFSGEVGNTLTKTTKIENWTKSDKCHLMSYGTKFTYKVKKQVWPKRNMWRINDMNKTT